MQSKLHLKASVQVGIHIEHVVLKWKVLHQRQEKNAGCQNTFLKIKKIYFNFQYGETLKKQQETT